MTERSRGLIVVEEEVKAETQRRRAESRQRSRGNDRAGRTLNVQRSTSNFEVRAQGRIVVGEPQSRLKERKTPPARTPTPLVPSVNTQQPATPNANFDVGRWTLSVGRSIPVYVASVIPDLVAAVGRVGSLRFFHIGFSA